MSKSAPLLLLLLALAACGSPQAAVNVSYKALKGSAIAYDAGMKSAADLYRQGKISDASRARIIKVAAKFSAAYGAASLTLADYADAIQGQDTTLAAQAKERLNHDLGLVASLLAELVAETDNQGATP